MDQVQLFIPIKAISGVCFMEADVKAMEGFYWPEPHPSTTRYVNMYKYYIKVEKISIKDKEKNA